MAETVSKRSIIYEIQTDFGKAKTDLKSAEQTVTKFGDELEKSATKAVRLSTQLRNMRNELAQLDEGSKEFQKLAIEAAKLEDRLGDVNQRVRNLASDTRNLDAFISIAQGIAGGFAVAQGAVALFGKENQNLIKALTKVQASLAILNGLQQLQATVLKESAAKTFIVTNAMKVYTFVTEGATFATKAFRAALVSTVVGAVIVGIGLLIQKFIELGETIGVVKDKQDDLNKSFDKFAQQANRLKSGLTLSERSSKDLREEIDRLKQSLDDIPRTSYSVQFPTGQQMQQDFEKFRGTVLEQIAKLQAELDRKEQPKLKIHVDKNIENIVKQTVDEIETQIGLAGAPIANIPSILTTVLEAQRQQLIATSESWQLYAGTVGNVTASLASIAKEGSQLQIVLSELSILANSAAAIAAAIRGGTESGAATGPAAVFTTPAFIATLVSTVFTAFAQSFALIKAAKAKQGELSTSGVQRSSFGFAEGTEYLERGKSPKGTDTIPVWANEGEAIIPTQENLKFPGLAGAWINGNLEDFIRVNYVAPALALKAFDESEKDSTIDYSNKFYRQLLVTKDGNMINSKALRVLNSIDRKLGITSKYGRA